MRDFRKYTNLKLERDVDGEGWYVSAVCKDNISTVRVSSTVSDYDQALGLLDFYIDKFIGSF